MICFLKMFFSFFFLVLVGLGRKTLQMLFIVQLYAAGKSAGIHFLSLTIFENRLYWINKNDTTVRSINKFRGLHRNGSQIEILSMLTYQPVALKAVHPVLQATSGQWLT